MSVAASSMDATSIIQDMQHRLPRHASGEDRAEALRLCKVVSRSL